MKNKQRIEAFFSGKKAEGFDNSTALDATVAHFPQLNPLYIRTHIRHCALWDQPCKRIFGPDKEMDNAIRYAAGLLDDMDNEEYIRGMCEILAVMYPAPDTCTHDRAEYIQLRIEQQVIAGNG